MGSDYQSDFYVSILEALNLHNSGQVNKASNHYMSLLEKWPDNPDLWHLLGVAAHQNNDNSLAEKLIKTALSLKNDVPDYFNNLGMVYRGLKKYKEAEQAFVRATKLNPKHSKAFSNLASLFRHNGKFETALEFARQSTTITPDNPEALNNLGNAEWDCGFNKNAVKNYRKAVFIQPDFALAHWNLALALLALGKFSEGFNEMAWRWKWNNFPGKRRYFEQPIWDGERLDKKTILLYPEQGLGDTIQFMRYSTLVRKFARRVILELPAELVPLANHSALADEIVIESGKGLEFDYHAPFLDLPRILRTTPATIPADVPYLAIDKKLQSKYRGLADKYTGLRIGVNWSGNQINPIDKFRRIPMDELKYLFDSPGVHWFSLQKDGKSTNTPVKNKTNLIDTGPAPLCETAALVSVLDLIITTDTAIAHLAGALNKPVWILLHHAPDWRWLTSGDTNAWYPTARLFRQNIPGDWRPVLKRVKTHLKALSK